MKVIIPAKSDSNRVPNKNWREFYHGKSLVDIKLFQLLEVFPASDIYVSCEDESRREEISAYGVNFWLRDPELSKDDTHWSDVVAGIIETIPCDDNEEIAWVQVPCPLFGAHDFKSAIARWRCIPKDLYDCLITVGVMKDFAVDENGCPLNFQYGRWHAVSQDLPSWYLIQRQFHVMKKGTYLRCHYDIGTRPYLYPVSPPSIDIDDEHEFRYAQHLYEERYGSTSQIS
jgi:N-acylneuraminate cytidylyltransferase